MEQASCVNFVPYMGTRRGLSASPYLSGSDDDTLDGALVRVIPDRDEFQRLCERPAPGAVEAVEWCDDMEAMCGRHYAIEAVYSNSCGYELTKSDTDDTFAVPFDACMFVSRDTSPEFRERFDVYI